MKSNDVVNEFILRRGLGLSYREISVQIKVSEKTLKIWGKKYVDKIAQAENKGLYTAIEVYNMSKADRLKAIADQIRAIDDELGKRDLSSVPVSRLIAIKLSILDLAGKVIGGADSDKNVLSPWDIMQNYLGAKKVPKE